MLRDRTDPARTLGGFKPRRQAGNHEPRAAGRSQRQLQVGEALRHALAQVLERGELHDPLFGRAAPTVTEVRVSPDLRRATVFIVPFAGGEPTPVIEALARAKGFLRHRLGQMVRLRVAPDLSFSADESFDAAARIDRLLREPTIARDLKRAEETDER